MIDVTLYTASHPALTLDEAWGSILDPSAIALIYSPRRCQFARSEGDGLYGVDGRPVDLTQVFEARVFSPQGELRWLRDSERSGVGSAVYLSESPLTLGDWQDASIFGLERLEQRYLLWGQALSAQIGDSQVSSGWVLLASSRIGKLPVPFAGGLAEGQGLRLCVREYLGPAPGEAGNDQPDGHGNWSVRAECLYAIESYGTSSAKTTASKGSHLMEKST